MKFKWTKIEQSAFNELKRIMDRDTLLSYPDFNEGFKIHTDARKVKLGVAIGQKSKPTAFYIRKLTDPQRIIQ